MREFKNKKKIVELSFKSEWKKIVFLIRHLTNTVLIKHYISVFMYWMLIIIEA